MLKERMDAKAAEYKEKMSRWGLEASAESLQMQRMLEELAPEHAHGYGISLAGFESRADAESQDSMDEADSCRSCSIPHRSIPHRTMHTPCA